VNAAPAQIEKASPRAIPGAWLAVCLGLIAVGVIAFLAGLVTESRTAWLAFHVNYLFWGALAQGAICVSCAFVIVGAHWPGPIRRIAEALGAWAPLTPLLFLVSWIGRASIYSPWLGHPSEAKAAYLTPVRLFTMDLGIFLALAALSIAFLYFSTRPTLAAFAEGAAGPAGGPAAGLFRRWTAGWRGEARERERSQRVTRVLAPIICLTYAFGWSFIAFDQVMSLAPTWYSNLFGAYFAWGGFLSGIAATALLAVLQGEITRDRMHDLGKMMFAFSIFWMYLFFSQYLVIWYGNLPEETSFVQGRLGSQFLMDKSGLGQLFLVQTWDLKFLWERLHEPYAMESLLVWACCWIVPFWVLLGQRPKRTPAILGTVAFIMVAGFWLERNVLVWPSLFPDQSLSFLGLVQIGIAAGFLGAFALVFLLYSRVFPSLAVPERS